MSKLSEYVIEHVDRGECQCGQCIDRVEHPEEHQPTGHTADLAFFVVSAKNNPDPEELTALVKAHQGGYGDVDLFDGREHSYMELGGWIGDQGLAMMLMGLGKILGLWELLTPRTVLGPDVPQELVMQLVGNGMIVIQAKAPVAQPEPVAPEKTEGVEEESLFMVGKDWAVDLFITDKDNLGLTIDRFTPEDDPQDKDNHWEDIYIEDNFEVSCPLRGFEELFVFPVIPPHMELRMFWKRWRVDVRRVDTFLIITIGHAEGLSTAEVDIYIDADMRIGSAIRE